MGDMTTAEHLTVEADHADRSDVLSRSTHEHEREREQPQPKRHPSLPALNLVTEQQIEVDLLESSPELEYNSEFPRGYQSSDSHPPWPHSPSASVSSLVATLTPSGGIYIELDEVDFEFDATPTLSECHERHSDKPFIGNPHHHNFGPTSVSVLPETDEPAGIGHSSFQLSLELLSPSPSVGEMSLGSEDDSDATSVCSDRTYRPGDERDRWVVCAVSLAEATPWNPIPLAPETPPEASFPSLLLSLPSRPGSPAISEISSDSSEGLFDPLLGLLALGSVSASKSERLLGWRTAHQEFGTEEGSPVVGSLGGNLRGTNNGAGIAPSCLPDNGSQGSDNPPDPDLGTVRLSSLPEGSLLEAQAAEYRCRNARSSLGVEPSVTQATYEERPRRTSLPTLVLQTSSCTSLLLVDSVSFPETPDTPRVIIFDRNDSDGEDALTGIPFDLSPIRPPVLGVDQTRTPPSCPTRTAAQHSPTCCPESQPRLASTNNSTRTKRARPHNRRAATSPAESDMRRRDKEDVHLTRIDKLFPRSSSTKHGLGGLSGLRGRRGRGPLSLFGLRRSLSVGGHGSKGLSGNHDGLAVSASSRPESPVGAECVRDLEGGRPERLSARSTFASTSATTSVRGSIDNNRSGSGDTQACKCQTAAHENSAPATPSALTLTPGERNQLDVPAPVSPATPVSPAQGPHSSTSPSAHAHGHCASCAAHTSATYPDPYPTSPHWRRFAQRYHYLPSSSRGSSPRSPYFPNHPHYDPRLQASDAVSAISAASGGSPASTAVSVIVPASPDSISWHGHGSGPRAGAGAATGGASAGPSLRTGPAPSDAQPATTDSCNHGQYQEIAMIRHDYGGQGLLELGAEPAGGDNGDRWELLALGGRIEPTTEVGASSGDASQGQGTTRDSNASRSVHIGTTQDVSSSNDEAEAAQPQQLLLGMLGKPQHLGHCAHGEHGVHGSPRVHSTTRVPSLPEAPEALAEFDRAGNATISHSGSVPKDDNSPTLEPVVDSDDHHSCHSCYPLELDLPDNSHDLDLDIDRLLHLRLQDLDQKQDQDRERNPDSVPLSPSLPLSPSPDPRLIAAQVAASTYHTYPTSAPAVTLFSKDFKDETTPKATEEDTDNLLSLGRHPTETRVSKVTTAVGPLSLATNLPTDVHAQLESPSSHPESEPWNPHHHLHPMFSPGHGNSGLGLGRKPSPRPSPLPSPAPSHGPSNDGSPLSPTTTSSASIPETKSTKEKPKKKGGWFRKSKDDSDVPSKTAEKKKKRRPAYGGGAGYLDSLMLPPGQPLQAVRAPGGGRVTGRSFRRAASSVEPMSPSWSHSQPDSDRAQSVRRPSSKSADNNVIVVEIDANDSPAASNHASLPPLTPQSSSAGQSSSQRFSSQTRSTQAPQTPNSLPLSLSPRSTAPRLDPLPTHLQHGESSSASVANKDRRLSQYTISSYSGSEYSQSAPTATMQRSASTGYYPLGERPSVSTVFEEDYQLQSHQDQRQAQPPDRRPSTVESDDGWARDSQGHGQRPSALQLQHTTIPARRQYTPSPGLPTVSLSPRTQRSSTISSSYSGHAKPKTPTSHPFASRRASSPNHTADHLDPPSGSIPAVPSNAFPGLNDNFKMPAAIAPAHQVALASPEDEQGDPDCPVCCESMSFTFRLPGEKPHVVPECGHALHEECFVTVYGPVPAEGSQKNIGVCGVCRQPMRVNGSDRSSGKNKLATLMGGGDSVSSGYEIVDPHSDDPLEPGPSPTSPTSGRSPSTEAPPLQVVVPRIEVRPEYQCVRRSKTGKQNVTALVIVEVPPAADRSKYPARQRKLSAADSYTHVPASPSSNGSFRESPTTAIQPQKTPFANVLADLKRRLVAYKYSGLDSVGALCLFDILKVRKATNVQDFHLYLFQDALICVSEERKSGITGGIFKKNTPESPNESVLRMRGRIFLRDVHQVSDTSTVNELSIALTLETQEHGVDSIVICFSDRNSHEMWRSTIRRLIDDAQVSSASAKMEKLLGQQPRPPSRSHSSTSSAGGHSTRPSGTVFHGSMMNLFADAGEACTHACPTPCPGALAFNVPIAPHHTPIDIVIAIATPALTPGAALPLKTRLMRTALHFVLATMGPRDRIAIVAAELGVNAVVRRTPLLNATRHDSRKRLEQFVEGIGAGKGDEFEIETQEEKPDVVTAVNVALDVILQRKVKNPLGGLVLISDASDLIKRQQMDLVTARLDAAKIPVHCFGYGKAHDPSPLWMISNHTYGTYTFVKEWYHLRDALAGVIGGLMSIALTKVGLRLACQDDDFRVVKVSGASQAVISSSGRDIDIDLNVLRHGEVREILIDFELESEPMPGTPFGTATPIDSSGEGEDGPTRPLSRQQSTSTTGQRRPSVARGYSGSSNGVNGNGLGELAAREAAVREASGTFDDARGVVEEVPVVEVDCTFHDPLAGRSAARMMNPLLLTLALLPPSSSPVSALADSVIVRRRMELLASDMITRALLAGSRRNFGQATRILRETKRILETKSDHLRASVSSTPHRSRRDIATLAAIDGLSATIQDVDMILDGIETNQDMFEADYRNYAAQQTVILRTQRSWTIRTPTEVAYATPDVQALIAASGEYAPRAQ